MVLPKRYTEEKTSKFMTANATTFYIGTGNSYALAPMKKTIK